MQKPSNTPVFPLSTLTFLWSCRHFSSQAALNHSLNTIEAPTQQQLRQAFEFLKDAPEVPVADIEAACRSAGINTATVTRAVQAGNINVVREVAVLEVLLLLLTMRCDSLGAVLKAAFDIFGKKVEGGNGEMRLEVPVLLQLLGFLGSRDPDVTPALRESVSRALDGHVNVTLKNLAGLPVLDSKLTAV